MRFTFPLNDSFFWSTIYFYRPEANIDFVSQRSGEKFSHDINTGVHLHPNTSFNAVEKDNLIYNLSTRFNEVSMEWNNDTIVWKLNDQLINKVDLKKLSAGNQSIERIFNNTFTLIMAITLRQEFCNDSNFNLNNINKSYLYINCIRVYKWNETDTKTHVGYNKILDLIIPVSLVIFFVIILIIFFVITTVYCMLNMKRENYTEIK